MKRLYLLSLIVLLAACASSERRVRTDKTAYLTNLSKFISGSPISEDSPFFNLSGLPFYKSYSIALNKLWATIDSENLKPIQKWENENLSLHSKNIKEVFYPFSGADFVNLYGFYPNSKKYLMVALENPGKISDPISITTDQMKKALQSLKILISEISERNYFRRRIMKQEFKNPHFSGVLPALLIFMTRMGLEVEEIANIEIDENGNEIQSRENLMATKKCNGVKIHFFDPKTNTSKELTYLSVMLGENSHEKITPEGNYFQKLKDFAVLMKSAEYLFFRINLNGFRDMLIQKSNIILQDDSGIPFNYFSANEWKINLFGKYTKPALLTGVPLQPVQTLLKDKFKSESSPLNFSYGYGILRGKNESNIMLFQRK